ncbi:12722_t:CDS:2, partial [Cetraspora pellucida]
DLRGFVEKVAERVEKLYSKFIDIDLYKSHFSLHLLGSAKEDRVKRPAISLVKKGYCELEDYLSIKDETALSMKASLVIAKYGWLEDQLYRFLRSNGCFILKYYWQKQYKPDHKGLVFRKVTEIFAKLKQEIVKKIADAISNPCPLVELSKTVINVEKLKNASEAYPNFLSTEKMTMLICSSSGTWKATVLRELLWH